MNEVEIAERLAALEQDKKAANHRIENLEKLTESVYFVGAIGKVDARGPQKHNGTCRKDRGTPCQTLGGCNLNNNYGAYIRSRRLYFIKNYRRLIQ